MTAKWSWLENVARSALAHVETVEATYQIASMALQSGVLGDFVECGVYAGAQCAAMAKAVIDAKASGRRVHLFDSFEGLPAAEERDTEIWNHHQARVGESLCSLEDVKGNMTRWGIPEDLLVYHPGWFEKTIRDALIPRPGMAFNHGIAVLRLDADLHSSTRTCMEFLYPLVNRGGWVIVDDWNLTGCREAVLERVMPAPIYWRIPTK